MHDPQLPSIMYWVWCSWSIAFP